MGTGPGRGSSSVRVPHATGRSLVLFNWPIRVKSLIGLGLLLLLVIVLAGSGLYTTFAYRSLVRG